jgi:ABC-type Co2+ transport system permease subunit
MSEEEEKKQKRDRRDLRWAFIPAVIFLLLYLVIPAPWNDYSLVLGIAFAVMTIGVLVTR